MQTATLHPNGITGKFVITQHGHMLKGVAYLLAPDGPKVLEMQVDLRPIAKALVRRVLKKNPSLATSFSGENEPSWDDVASGFGREERDLMIDDTWQRNPRETFGCQALGARNASFGVFGCATVRGLPQSEVVIGGMWGKLKKTARKVGKNKILKAVDKASRAVVRSKITGAIVGVAAVVYPPVGIPAAAAYASANMVLDRIDQAKKIKNQAVKMLKSGRSAAVKAVKKAAPLIKKSQVQSVRMKQSVRKIAEKSRRGDPDAATAARVLSIAHASRQKIAALTGKQPGPIMPGFLVTPQGKIIKGQWLANRGRAPVKIGGCIGCQ